MTGLLPNMRLEGQHAVITGGGTGIGAAIAQALAGEGAKITILGRRAEALKTTAAALAARGLPNIFFTTCDVTDPMRVRDAMQYARDRNGRIDILVPNAGAAISGPFAKTSYETFRQMLAVNLDGVFHCCQEALPDLLAAGRGRILAIASTASLRGFPYSAAYGTAKHAALGLIRMIAADYAGTSLTANAVCPGYTDTELVDTAATRVSARTGQGTDQLKIQFGGFNPSGRLIQPAEVAVVVLDLILSDRNGEAVVIE